MFKLLDKIALRVGRFVVYPIAAVLLFTLVYVPTHAYMHADDNQLIVYWSAYHGAPEGATLNLFSISHRSDFTVYYDEAQTFLSFVEQAAPEDVIMIDGMRVWRRQVSRAYFSEPSRFPQ